MEKSGDPEDLKDFDLGGWVARWMREELPELDGKTPRKCCAIPRDSALSKVLERMRGGLAA